jgi:ACR3 family arsenite transporter
MSVSESRVGSGAAPEQQPVMGIFERFLTLWVALCIVTGIALGQVVPGLFRVIGDATVA